MLLVAGGALAAGYLACFAYRAASFALFFVLTSSGIGLHVLGLEPSAPLAGGHLGRMAFESERALVWIGLGAAAAALMFLALVAPKLSAWRGSSACLWLLGGCTLGAAALDLHYGLTPLGERRWIERGYNARGLVVARRATVEELQALPDSSSGLVMEVEGVLEYHEGLKRFHLHGLEEPGRYVKVYFHKGSRTSLSELQPGGKPRYHDLLAPSLGRRVRVLGTAVCGAIQVEVSDVALAR